MDKFSSQICTFAENIIGIPFPTLASSEPSFWTTLIASAGSGLVVGLMTIAVAYHQRQHDMEKLQQEHAHDLGVRKQERDLLDRKKIYIDAIDALMALSNKLLRLPNHPIDTLATDDHHAAIQRVHLVAKVEVIELLNACGKHFSEAMLNFMPRKMLIESMQIDLDIGAKENSDSLLRIKEITKITQDLLLAQNHEKHIWERFMEESKLLSQKMDEKAEELDRIRKEQLTQKMSLTSDVSQTLLSFSEKFTCLLVAIRDEIDNTFTAEDEERYRAGCARSSREAMQAIDVFMKVDMKNMIDEVVKN